MGVLNLTPDSFSDGGQFLDRQAAISRGLQLVSEGADILDLGAESTRPGANPLSPGEEWQRLEGPLRALLNCGVPISVDTRHAQTMVKALELGVDMINDVSGMQSEEAVAAVAASNCGVCVMHMQGQPLTMQDTPNYRDVVGEVNQFLYDRTRALERAGIAASRIVLDPGIGFGKTPEHNIQLIKGLDRLGSGQFPVLVGLSRKSLIGHLTGQPVDQRVYGSVVAAVAAVFQGAAIVRVHDVAATRDALRVFAALGT